MGTTVTPPQSKAALAARRQAEFYADKPLSLSDLAHGLIMDQIFSYLDSRALYRVACLTSQSLSQFVTTKHVVYSAVTSGGSARESLNRIVHLLKREAIHAPSRLRLLRILNGVACERGEDCVQHGFNDLDFEAAPGQRYTLVVDGSGATQAGAFEVEIACE